MISKILKHIIPNGIMKKEGIRWLVLFVGIVFLSAAVYRIFDYSVGVGEFNQLKIPLFFLPFIIILEIILGVLFILNKKVVYASVVSIIFLSVAVLVAFISNFSAIIINLSELFSFRANPVDILLHIMYIFLLFLIYLEYKKNKRSQNK